MFSVKQLFCLQKSQNHTYSIFQKQQLFLNFKFVLWAAKPHDLYLLNYKFTVIYWSTFANFHIYSSVFWSLMMKSALWWINLKPQFLIMF